MPAAVTVRRTFRKESIKSPEEFSFVVPPGLMPVVPCVCARACVVRFREVEKQKSVIPAPDVQPKVLTRSPPRDFSAALPCFGGEHVVAWARTSSRPVLSWGRSGAGWGGGVCVCVCGVTGRRGKPSPSLSRHRPRAWAGTAHSPSANSLSAAPARDSVLKER